MATPQVIAEIRTESGDSLYDDTNDALKIVGPAAHDAAAAGAPVLIGAEADETSADSVDEGDVGKLRMTLARLLKTESSWGVPTHLVDDETDDDSNKHFSPTAGKLWYISSISVHVVASGTSGNREIQLKVRDYSSGGAGGDVILHIAAGAVIAASQSREIVFMSGVGGKETSYVGTNLAQLFAPLPQPFVLTDSMTVQIYDVAAVDAADDRMQIHALGMEANE
jgi:hypothetical protein